MGKKRLNRAVSAALLAVFVLSPLFADSSISTIHVKPFLIFARDSTKTTFSARIPTISGASPRLVQLVRLQATGDETEVAVLKQQPLSTIHPIKDNRIYSTQLTLKEPIAGLVSFTVQAIYPNGTVLRSPPVFLNILGGLSSKERKIVISTLTEGRDRYDQAAESKSLKDAQADTVEWLRVQPGVAIIAPQPNFNILVQFRSGFQTNLEIPDLTYEGTYSQNNR